MSFDAASLTVSQPLRRALALALFVAALVLVAMGVVWPAIASFDTLAASVVDSEAALQRFTAVAARLPRLEAENATLKRAFATQGGFLQATNESLIAAELQNRIKRAVEANGGQLKSTQILPIADENGMRRVTARVEVQGNTAALQRIWYEMETGTPYLFINTFDIESRQVRRDRTGPPAYEISARFELSAYARVGSP
ncbi:MAG TPA: type II secretion system protein GspM [Stellaceae bacterium]|nr:type II secretion system protein GspM [Stellaceae bacterium]